MGGFGSGRYGGRPTADAANRIDVAWMLRRGLARDGWYRVGTLNWSWGDGSPAGSIRYSADMRDPEHARLVLSYVREKEGEREEVEQVVRLTYTQPNFGGRRWWMICPYRGHRVAKLYMPRGGDRFASRKAWQLGYNSQRIAARDRPFEALFRLQKKLGCERGWGNYPTRPKGMHQRTFERHLDEFDYLDNLCAIEMMRAVGVIDAELRF